MSTTHQKPNKEVLTAVERVVELFVAAGMLLLLSFLRYHQRVETGFFTEEFGSLEMLALYGPIVVSFAPPLIRAIIGRRNPARPWEAATSLFLGIGSLWLLIVFPFDFTHLADPLPASIRFVLAWVTNGIGIIPLIIQVITGPIGAAVALWQYIAVRSREFTAPSVQQPG